MHRSIFRVVLVAAVTVLVIAPATRGQDGPIAEAQRHQQEGMAAYQEGDYEGFARSMKRALELNPSSHATRYNLACGYARTGREAEALDLLQELARQKVDFGMAQDPDLESLRDEPRFQELVAFLEESIVPISNSTLRLRVEQLGLMPEGIAADPRDGRLFFGSMRTGDIYVLDPGERLSRFATLGHDARRAAIGLTVDVTRNLLWVVGTHFFMAEGFDPEADLAAGLFAFDLDTGRLAKEHLSPTGEGLNDVAVAPSGDVYTSGGSLLVLRAGTEELVKVPSTPEIPGSNGLTLDAAGETLFVSVYPVGIGAIDLASGHLRYLQTPEGTTLYGIDGLYWHDGDLVGLQNGLQPWRLLRIALNADATAVDDVRVIEFANDAIFPMTGAILGDEIHYIGRGPAPEEPPKHFGAPLAPFLGETVIMTAPLGEEGEAAH